MMTKAYDIKFRRLAVLLCLLPSLLQAAASDAELAQARWYQVEVIVFEQLNKAYAQNEHWPELAGVKLAPNAAALNPPMPPEPALPQLATPAFTQISPLPTTTVPATIQPDQPTTLAEQADTTVPLPTPFEILEPQDLQLDKVYTSLRRSQGFRPLLHVAWRQPTYEREQAQPILIYNGIEEPAPPAAAQPPLTPPPLGTLPVEPASPLPAEELRFLPGQAQYPSAEDLRIGPPNPRFVGTLKLSVSRYLHLDADLFYRRMSSQLAAVRVPDYVLWTDRPYPTLRQLQGPAFVAETWEAIRGFELKESRRMRSGEIHYLDHPYFGLIVLVTPYELPTPPPEEHIPAPRQNIN